MEDGIKIYKPKKDVMGGGLVVLAIVFFGLTLPVLVEGAPVTLEKLVGLAGFWTFGIILTAIPFMFKLEVGADYIKSYFLGFCIRNLHASDIQALEYGNLMRWGSAGYGKGHKGWGKTRNEGVKYFSMGENFYGREAIEHVRQVLDPKNR